MMRMDNDTDSGRERRYFRVNRSGLSLLRDSRRTMARFWEGLDPELGER